MNPYRKLRLVEQDDPTLRVLPSWLDAYLRIVTSPTSGRPDCCCDAFIVIFPLVIAVLLPTAAYFDPSRNQQMTIFGMILAMSFTVHLILMAVFHKRIRQYKIEAIESLNKFEQEMEDDKQREQDVFASFNKILSLKLSCASCRSKIAASLLISLGFEESDVIRHKLGINDAPPTEPCTYCWTQLLHS